MVWWFGQCFGNPIALCMWVDEGSDLLVFPGHQRRLDGWRIALLAVAGAMFLQMMIITAS